MKCKGQTKKATPFIKKLHNWNEYEYILLAAILESVGTNTFRAFQNCPHPPSKVFRNWAKSWLIKKDRFQRLNEIKSMECYDKWLYESVEDLQGQWQKSMKKALDNCVQIQQGQRQESKKKEIDRCVKILQDKQPESIKTGLDIVQAYKLVNLLLKRICRELPLKERNRIFQWLHVPLDKYTLKAIRPFIRLCNGNKIRANATMGSIKSIKDYNHIQREIRELAKRELVVPPIALDYCAFNDREDI